MKLNTNKIFSVKRLISLPLATVVLSMSSCATALVRGQGDIGQDFIYPATIIDAQAFYESGIKGVPPISMPNSEEKNGVVTRLLFMVGGVVDLPVSIVTDTVMLPFDIYQIGKGGDSQQ